MTMSFSPFVWIAVIVLLAIFWPLAQSLRHENLKPLAAYLLFTSVFALVSALIFSLAVWIGRALLPEAMMLAPMAASVTLLVSIVPAFSAAFWIVRRPQVRRMPR